jgi:EmrB/QacA subfamily drug resistance transporter/deazaflavin-dependent oxidoreductase (nitroreductase family)
VTLARNRSNRPLILASLLLAAFAINLDTTVVNVALPTLVRELQASTTQLEWIVDAYNLMFAALVLAAGNLGDRVGRKGVLLAGLGTFGVATIAGGLGTSPGELIAARAVMGLGAALIFPATLSLLTNVFTERAERARAIGLWGATTGIGIALGPIVGGWLLERDGWQSVFFALAPIAALGMVLVSVYVPSSRDPEAPPADRPGLVLSTGAMAILIYTIIEAPNHGWAAARSIGGFALAAALLVGFIAWERRAAAPMLDVGLFRNLRFSAASGAVTISFFSLMGFIFLVTLYFQFLKDYGPFSTGVRLLPVATLTGVTSVLGTGLAVRSSTKLVVSGGLVSLAAGLAWTSTASESTTYLTIAGQMVLIGSGIGLTSAPATESIMGAVPPGKAGIGSAVNDATRIMGGTLGVAVIGSVYASLYSSRLSTGLSAQLPDAIARGAERSVGAAFGAAGQLQATGQSTLSRGLHDAASSAFFDGFAVACLVAAGVAIGGAALAAALLPAQPQRAGASRASPVHPFPRRSMMSTNIGPDGSAADPGGANLSPVERFWRNRLFARMRHHLTWLRRSSPALTRAHAAAIRLSGGRIRRSFVFTGGMPILVLTTVGRKSGRSRSTPVGFLRHGEAFAVLASNAGNDRSPAWWLNLQANPRAEILSAGTRYTVTARRADTEEEAALWMEFATKNPGFDEYRNLTERQIPVVILEPDKRMSSPSSHPEDLARSAF